MSEPLTIIWVLFQLIIGYNLIVPFCLLLLKNLRSRNTLPPASSENPADYAIIITAYKFTDTLPNVVSSILNLNYSNFLIYIVADNCNGADLNFQNDKVILLRPDTVLASNTKSHFYAINNFRRDHQRLTIIDSDNIVHPEFLNQLNTYFDEGFEAVQGIRHAKNLDTIYACLDAARDIYYHYYDGAALFRCGSSATLAGSGMAFSTSLYKNCLASRSIEGAGFDKVLQFEIVKRNKRIAYSEHAVVYDEKTSRPEQLVNQRSRWINTWFKYYSFGFTLLGLGVKNFSINQFLFGLILLRPPLFIFLLLSAGLAFINIFLSPVVAIIWLTGFIFFVSAFLIALFGSKTDRRIYGSLINIPQFVFYQFISLLNIRKANKRSVSTEHYHINKNLEDLKR